MRHLSLLLRFTRRSITLRFRQKHRLTALLNPISQRSIRFLSHLNITSHLIHLIRHNLRLNSSLQIINRINRQNINKAILLLRPDQRHLSIRNSRYNSRQLIIASRRTLASRPINTSPILRSDQNRVLTTNNRSRFLLTTNSLRRTLTIRFTSITTIRPPINIRRLINNLLVLPMTLRSLPTPRRSLAIINSLSSNS